MTTGPVRSTVVRCRRVLSFAVHYAWLFLRANFVVAREIVSPGQGVAPAIVEIRLRSRTSFEISAYMSLISLTPGTLALALDDTRTRLAVHGMHAEDTDSFAADLRDLEDRMLRAWRPVDAAEPTPPGEGN